ncbi:regulatory iron-sulfur-containing complex subunit RicT [Algoriphagus hitonicola]|uniref:Cell fate regulator YaaT, PSP1 superfamily (Controls sporulation, competence, biofilm development) n=1 Tax=Algoriphagus hitonicola TaxID=435880 RepID=A0A1I2NKL7_9BACT|nr:regulatory iron-sulfur-containing complex subunit RicT [Algoriphagus hitonicola]SFG04424.1 Cell fate regulator YaaT, PSP1 superfamily (controls sporulation, competence, biofilm development) [Algoriphagus hitonicola]
MSGCSSCSTTTGGSGGCQNNGTCGTSDCNKMNAFDWLSHMGIPQVDTYDIVEIKFKGGRKEYYRNVDYLSLNTGDPVVVDVPSGHHIGYVSLQGELVRLQMQKRKIRNDDSILRIYRIANPKDLEKWEEARNREMPTLYRCRQIVDELGLKMKMSDVEYQADNSKATFYYSADERVDFRELIKVLAGEFKIRVEMRQISLRQEAGRLGGIGVCGRELCCSTWLVDFKNVSTSAARYQNLSLNPSKLSGQCGRLKCCLNYELDTYMDAIKDIPSVEKPLQTEQGPAKLQKTDIFRKLMWFSYNHDNDWHSITCERVKEIQDLNNQEKKVFNLQFNESSELEDLAAQSTRELEILDKKFTKKKKKKKPRNKSQNNQNQDLPVSAKPISPPTRNPRNQETESRKPDQANPENRKRRNKNRRKPPGAQGQPQKPQNPESSGSTQKPNPQKSQQEGKRKFPPRRNQGPNPNNGSGNE